MFVLSHLSPCSGPILGLVLLFILILSACCEAHAAYQNQNALPRAGSQHKSPLSSFFLPADPGYSSGKGRHKGGRGGTNCPPLSQQLLGEPIKGSNSVHTFPSFTGCAHFSSCDVSRHCFLRHYVLTL